MENFYQQQLNEFHMKQCKKLYACKHIYPCQYVNMSETVNNTGTISLNIYNETDGMPVPNVTITIYVTDGINRDIPVMYLVTALNPIRIELPMASVLGTQVFGPEYSFSTYDFRVEAFGYFASNVYNVRLFPNVTTAYDISLIPVTSIQKPPVKIEERIETPPHLRDELIK